MNTRSVFIHSPLRTLAAVMVLALGFSVVGTAEAGPRTRIGVWVGAPWGFGPGYWGPGYWGPGYGYGYYGYVPPPAPVIVQAAPSNVAPAVAQQAQSWYYCPASQMYYPHVRDCAVDWQEVPVTSAPSAGPERTESTTSGTSAGSGASTADAPKTGSVSTVPARSTGTPVPRAPAKAD